MFSYSLRFLPYDTKNYIGCRSCMKCKVAQIRSIKEEWLVVEAIDMLKTGAVSHEENGNQNPRKYHVTYGMSNRKKIIRLSNLWRKKNHYALLVGA